MSAVEIPDNTLKEILTVIGYPFAESDDMEISFEDLRDFIIVQGIKEYFRWFPIQEEQTSGVTGTFSFPFPDARTFGATEIRLVTGRGRGGAYGNPLVDERFIRPGGMGRRMYGTRNTYGFGEAVPGARAEAQSLVNYNRAWRANVNLQTRALEGFSNVPATLVFKWNKYSTNWLDIPFEREYDVIKLCQAFVLDWFVGLRTQEQSDDIPVSFNLAEMKEKAEKLRTEVMDKFKNFTKVVLIRS